MRLVTRVARSRTQPALATVQWLARNIVDCAWVRMDLPLVFPVYPLVRG